MADPFLEVAVDAARRAGALLLGRLGTLRTIDYKGSPSNIVTEMDRQAESLIVGCIAERFPDHAVLAEEGGARAGSASHRWIVDPLDGTTNYAHGMPFFAVSIALEIEGAVVLGVVYDPNATSALRRGAGTARSSTTSACAYPRRRAWTRACSPPAIPTTSARFATTISPSTRPSCAVPERARDGLGRDQPGAGRRRTARRVLELKLGPWDVAAGCLMVEEAGGA